MKSYKDYQQMMAHLMRQGYNKGGYVKRKPFQFGGGVEAQLKGSAAAKKIAMEKQPDRIRPSFYDGKLNIKGPKDQIKNYLKDLEKRFEFPITSQNYLKGIKDGSILSNEALAKKYKVNLADVERINRVLKRDNKLEYKKQTLEGEKKRQRERDVRRKADIRKISSPAMEQKIKRAIKKVDPKALAKEVDVAHRASLKANSAVGADYLTTSLGIDKKIVNQELVKPTEQKLGTLYRNQQKLIKNLKPGKVPKETQKEIEKINKKISELSDRTKGALQGVLIDEKTLKPSIYGIDYKKVLGAGLVDKPVKDLTKADLDLIKLQIPEQIKAARSSGPTLGANIGLLKGVGETIKAIPTPTGAVALNLAFQPDLSSGIDRAALGAEAAFAPELVRQTSRVSSAPIVQRFFNLGLSPQLAARAARVVSPLGLATLAGEGVYQLGRLGAEQRRRMQEMTPEQRRLFDAEQQSISEFAAAGGGIAKLAGKESGPPPEKGPDSEGLASLLKNVKKR